MGITSEIQSKPPATASVAASSASKASNAATGRQRAATQRTDQQRERILQIAAQLFAEQGYASTTMAQIVRALGVTKPFVYYYFRDKQEIFETLSWHPAVDCLTAMDFPEDDRRRAVVKVMEGIERLIRLTIAHHPCSFFAYREPQVYRPEYRAAALKLAHHFYDRMCPLLEEARNDGDLDFDDAKITALVACSLPGFCYTWYRPDGLLSPDEMVNTLCGYAWRVIGLR